jgi:hypothetical protein
VLRLGRSLGSDPSFLRSVPHEGAARETRPPFKEGILMAAKIPVLRSLAEATRVVAPEARPSRPAAPAGRAVSRDPLYETDRYRLVVPLVKRPGTIASRVPVPLPRESGA